MFRVNNNRSSSLFSLQTHLIFERMEARMISKVMTVGAALGLVIGTSSIGWTASSTTSRAPGHLMQQKGSVKGHPGASGYAPGHLMQQKGSKTGNPGASGYAPGWSTSTTGQGTSPAR